MKPDQERVRCLLRDTIALLCKNGLHFDTDLRVQGLLGVTVDSNDVFIVHIDELIDATAKAKFEIENDSDNDEELPTSYNMPSESDCSGSGQKQVTQDNDTHHGSSSSSQRRKRKASSPLRIDTTNLLREFNCSDVAESEWLPDQVSGCIGMSSDCVTADSPPLSPRVNSKQLDEEAPEDLSLYGMSVKLEEPSSDDDVMLIDARDGGELDRLQSVAQNNYHSDAEQSDSLPYMACVPPINPRHRHRLSSTCKPSSTATDVQNLVDQRQVAVTQNAEFSQLHSTCHSPAGRLTCQNSTKPKSAESSPLGTNLPLSAAGAHHQIPLLMAHRSLPPSLYSAEWAVQRLLSWSRGRGSHHHMVRAPTRRKRYECTLNDCGRQYLNTFDLYRHQRQKHMMPADFYQQGKKQTFGIREVIDPGSSSSNNCATALKSSDNSSLLNDHSALGGSSCIGASDAVAKW